LAARRNLTDDQRAMNAAALAEDEAKLAMRERAKKGGEAGGRGRPKAQDDSSATDVSAKQSQSKGRTPRSTEKAAKRSRVSERKVRQAQAIRKKAPKLAEQVLAGDLTLAAKHQHLLNVYAPVKEDAAKRKQEGQVKGGRAAGRGRPKDDRSVQLVAPSESSPEDRKTRSLRAKSAGTNRTYIDLADKLDQFSRIDKDAKEARNQHISSEDADFFKKILTGACLNTRLLYNVYNMAWVHLIGDRRFMTRGAFC